MPKSADFGSVARAIMTTDSVPKLASAQAGEATVLGIAKGSGMIEPDMATLLVYLVTDAAVAAERGHGRGVPAHGGCDVQFAFDRHRHVDFRFGLAPFQRGCGARRDGGFRARARRRLPLTSPCNLPLTPRGPAR